ncbi:MAG: hypothetical protein ACLVKO_02305 [Dysgonomonas sp.]
MIYSVLSHTTFVEVGNIKMEAPVCFYGAIPESKEQSFRLLL